MLNTISRISFPNGNTTERLFRFRGVDSNLCALIGATVQKGGAFTIRPATLAEVAANDTARAIAERQVKL
jgi:hypothetical protein